jgi:hypothetical protein
MKWLVLLLRYALGIIILVYAYVKIINFQFTIPDEFKSVPIGEADGVLLTFSFFGHSSWFSFLLGIAELIPAVFLFFKRTAFLGALLLFPVLSFIFLINIAYDFVPVMKVWTASLLSLNLILLFYYKKRLAAIFFAAIA